MCDTDVHHPSIRQQAEEKGAMIDLDEYDRLFQKMEDLFQGLTSVVSIKAVDDDENDIVENGRRGMHPSSNALADERDDLDTEFDFLKETEDKIAAELLELSELIRSASSADDRSTREMSVKLKSKDKKLSSNHKRADSSELDKAILKQLEEFRVNGGGSKRQTDNRKNQVPGKETMKKIDALRPISSESQDSEDEGHIFHSNSPLDSPDASRHDRSVGKSQYAIKEENVEVSIFHGDVEVEIDGSDDMDSERWLTPRTIDRTSLLPFAISAATLCTIQKRIPK